jgi:hypothetical protein
MAYTPSAIDLCTLAQLKEYLGIPTGTTAADDLLQGLLTASSQFLATWCDRTFQVVAYNEIRDSRGPTFVTLGYPLVSVTGVTVDGRPIPPGQGWPRQGYFSSLWAIRIDGYGVPRDGYQNVNLQYTAGYAVIPADLQQAAIELSALKYKQKDRIGISGSEGIDGQSITYRDLAMSQAVLAVAMRYKRVVQIAQ